MFHVLNARITFGNIFAMDNPVAHVSKVQEEDRVTCVLDEAIFQIPPGYTQIGNGKVQAPFCFFLVFFCSSSLLFVWQVVFGFCVSNSI